MPNPFNFENRLPIPPSRETPDSSGSVTPPPSPKNPPGGENDSSSNIKTLKYPLNIDNETQRYGQTRLAIKIYKNITQENKNFLNKIEDVAGNVAEIAVAAITSGNPSIREITRSDKVDTVIFLPMPLSIKTNYNVSYSDPSIVEAIAGVGENVSKGLTNMIPVKGRNVGIPNLSAKSLKTLSILQSITAIASAGLANKPQVKIGLGAAGLAINPHQELLLDGVKFREFELTYKIMPKNEKESEIVKSIIHAIKVNMHPGLSSSFLFKYPSEFELHFYTGTKENINTYLFKTKRCVLHSFDVDYSGEGNFVTFKNSNGNTSGAPVQINLTMKFKETEILTVSDSGISESEQYTF